MQLITGFRRPGSAICGILLLMLLLFSCNKHDSENCYICTTTYTTTTDVPVSGYPFINSIDKELCDMTPEQIEEYMQTYTVTETPITISGVTYSGSKVTTCIKE